MDIFGENFDSKVIDYNKILSCWIFFKEGISYLKARLLKLMKMRKTGVLDEGEREIEPK